MLKRNKSNDNLKRKILKRKVILCMNSTGLVVINKRFCSSHSKATCAMLGRG